MHIYLYIYINIVKQNYNYINNDIYISISIHIYIYIIFPIYIYNCISISISISIPISISIYIYIYIYIYIPQARILWQFCKKPASMNTITITYMFINSGVQTFREPFAALSRSFATAAKTHIHMCRCHSDTKSLAWVLERLPYIYIYIYVFFSRPLPLSKGSVSKMGLNPQEKTPAQGWKGTLKYHRYRYRYIGCRYRDIDMCFVNTLTSVQSWMYHDVSAEISAWRALYAKTTALVTGSNHARWGWKEEHST